VKISDILQPRGIIPFLETASKEAILKTLLEHAYGAMQDVLEHTSKVAVLEALEVRERVSPTGLGEGVAIPHTRVPGLSQLAAVFARVPGGIDFDALDHKNVTLFFMLLVPENSQGEHLKALARITRLLKNGDFRRVLLGLDTADLLYQAFIEEDKKLG
jgi:PTS system nitrogen regulatory IIA component